MSENSKLIISRMSPFLKRYGLVICALVVWLGVWTFVVRGVPYRLYTFVPVLACTLFLSVFLTYWSRLRFIPIILWASVPALFMLFFSAWLISFISTDTTTYYLGMDIRTPDGIKTCSSMVQYKNRFFHFWPGQFNTSSSSLKGEAVFCDLDDGKNLVAVLAFEKDLEGKRTLSMLPWLAAGLPVKYREKRLPFIHGRQGLTEKLTPILVSFSDINDPMTMKRVYPGQLADIWGKGYSIQNVWVESTNDPFKSAEIQLRLPWVGSRSDDGTWVYVRPFRKLGL